MGNRPSTGLAQRCPSTCYHAPPLATTTGRFCSRESAAAAASLYKKRVNGCSGQTAPATMAFYTKRLAEEVVVTMASPSITAVLPTRHSVSRTPLRRAISTALTLTQACTVCAGPYRGAKVELLAEVNRAGSRQAVGDGCRYRAGCQEVVRDACAKNRGGRKRYVGMYRVVVIRDDGEQKNIGRGEGLGVRRLLVQSNAFDVVAGRIVLALSRPFCCMFLACTASSHSPKYQNWLWRSLQHCHGTAPPSTHGFSPRTGGAIGVFGSLPCQQPPCASPHPAWRIPSPDVS